MIYKKDLCKFDDFKNMSLNQRKIYLDKIYGNSSKHTALAVIKEFSLSKIEFEMEYFIFQNNILQKFCLFKDNSYANFSSSKNNTLILFRQKNFSAADKLNPIFFNPILEKKPAQNISKFYKKIGIEYEPNNFYELHDENNNSLEILILGDMNEKFKNFVDEKNFQLQQLQKKISAARAELKFFETFGISFEPATEIENVPNEKIFDNFGEMINYWQSHLNSAAHGFLKYDKRILESLYFALQLNQLILLTGNPGTGKTSLVKALAKSFNFAVKIIPVQSNWTDKTDLLGYYNPLEKNYFATPFLDALINFSRQAEKSPEKLFIICLDEMNLAHVEYYFAEFLSVLQDNENPEITLYSPQLQQNILYELKNSGFTENSPLENLTLPERQYFFELRRRAQMLKNYPAKFKIPKNVKFFGTLNQDETTLDISPKVLDRSYVIRIEKFFDGDKIPRGIENPLHYKPLENYLPQFNKINFDLSKSDFQNFEAANISRRVTDKILDDEKFSAWGAVLTAPKIYDFIIASCVLPKIRLSDENYELYAADIEKLCKDLSREIWQHINSPKDKQADFWRR